MTNGYDDLYAVESYGPLVGEPAASEAFIDPNPFYGPASTELQTVGPGPEPVPSGDTGNLFGDLFKTVGGVVTAGLTSVANVSGALLTRSLFPPPSPASPGLIPFSVGSRGIPGLPSGTGGGGPSFIPRMSGPGETNPLSFLMSPWVIIGIMGFIFVTIFMRRR